MIVRSFAAHQIVAATPPRALGPYFCEWRRARQPARGLLRGANIRSRLQATRLTIQEIAHRLGLALALASQFAHSASRSMGATGFRRTALLAACSDGTKCDKRSHQADFKWVSDYQT